jgi:hypothetical protein
MILLLLLSGSISAIVADHQWVGGTSRESSGESIEGSIKESSRVAISRTRTATSSALPVAGNRRLFSRRRLLPEIAGYTWISPLGTSGVMIKGQTESATINNVNKLCFSTTDQKFSGPASIVFELYFESSAALYISQTTTAPSRSNNLYLLGKGGRYTIQMTENAANENSCAEKANSFGRDDISDNIFNFDQEPDNNNDCVSPDCTYFGCSCVGKYSDLDEVRQCYILTTILTTHEQKLFFQNIA